MVSDLLHLEFVSGKLPLTTSTHQGLLTYGASISFQTHCSAYIKSVCAYLYKCLDTYSVLLKALKNMTYFLNMSWNYSLSVNLLKNSLKPNSKNRTLKLVLSIVPLCLSNHFSLLCLYRSQEPCMMRREYHLLRIVQTWWLSLWSLVQERQ